MAEIKHIEQFEYYYSLGCDRSHRKVAEQFGKTTKAVDGWASREGWMEEVRRRDNEKIKKNRQDNLLSRREKVNDYLKVVHTSIGAYVDKLKKGKIEIKGVKDLDVLLRLWAFLDSYALEGESAIIAEYEKEKEQSKEQENDNTIRISFDIEGEPIDENSP